MIKDIFILALLLVTPAFGQVDVKKESDTSKVFKELSVIGEMKTAVIDSMKALKRRRDSLEKFGPGDFVRSYNVDGADGSRVIWNFIYQIKGKDTLFQRVDKVYTYWKP